MGNKLCAPLWKKGYRGDDNPWTPKKDSHLLRLWAEIFEVQEQDGDVCWAPVSTDVVPVNITCIQDTPEIVFQITAYNRHVEKIFDVKLIQPGTRLTQTSECFVHWRDSQYEHDWGLNFTTTVDARRFRECCMCPTSQNYARKTSASGSLSISPPKRVRARKAISNPTSPVNDSPRRAISTPDDLGRQETTPATPSVAHPGDSEIERRKQQRLTAPPDMHNLYGEQNTRHDKRASSVSVYDNINTSVNHKIDRNGSDATVRHRPPPHPSSVHRPIAEREIPYNIYHQTTSRSHYHTYQSYAQNNASDQYDSSGSGQSDPRRDYAEIRWQGNCLPTNGSRGYYSGQATDQDGLDGIQLQFADSDNVCQVNSECVSDGKKEQTGEPTTPKLTETFDSSTLKKMLQVLPDTSPSMKEGGKQFEYAGSNNGCPPSRPPSGREGGVVTRTGRPVKPERVSSNPGVVMRHCRDSYPGTQSSGSYQQNTDAFKAATVDRAVRAATLPPGVGLGYRGHNLAGHPLDFAHPCASDGAEPRHTSSDVSDSESESSSDTGTSDGSLRTMPSQSQMSLASKSAAVRKAGWLSVKNWLVHHKKKIELASKRSWKNYWVCLKGTMLLFYTCEENEAVREDSVPRHMLVIEGAIAQALPEHPKKEFIYSLSTAFGDAYLFQATSQVDLENWICGIHSACASSFARQHGKENTLKLLHSEIEKLENSIDLDIKMKKMAEMQMSVVVDPRSKHAIDKQICQWDENLEKLYIEQYRLRCYTCSLQGTELPNPKPILSCVSKATKTILNRVGVFTVSSFHACVCARVPVTSANLYSRTAKRGLLSTFKADSLTRLKPRSPKPCPVHTSRMFKTADSSERVLGVLNDLNRTSHAPLERVSSRDALVHMLLPGGHMVVVCVSDKMTTQEVLEYMCNKCMLVPNDHFIRLRLDGNTYKVPEKSVVLQSEDYEGVEILQKIIFQMQLLKTDRDVEFGFVAEAELADDADQEDELCVFISEVSKGGLAQRKGLGVGDEILVINSKVIAELDMVYVEELLQDSDAIYMTVRSCRSEKPGVTTVQMEHADVYIENMMCPPPPSQSRISDKLIDQLIVPAPNIVEPEKSDDEDVEKPSSKNVAAVSSQEIDTLLQGAEQVTHLCRLLHGHAGKMSNNEVAPLCKPLSDSQRIRKVIRELIETERHYVKDLKCLIERYLEPLKEETFLTGDDIQQLFGNIREIVQFQQLFMQSLEDSVLIEPNFNILDNPKQFKDADLRRVLFCLGGSFLHYANHFKLYSSFCASHSKAQKVLNPETNAPLQEFLRARNPKQQHSATLESFLIKPIQRILKYPLLLRQLCDLTDLQTDEHHHLSEALRGMEAVAEHINEMQKIYEEYGHVFDELTRQYRDSHAHTKSLDLNVGELQMYGSVNWLNALDELGKMKKGTELLTLVFVFRGGIVMMALERVKSKKKQKQPAGRPPAVLDCSDVTRYQTVIPIDELQVRSATAHTDSHGLWELVHCRSRKEGRPESVFQFASSTDAKREFLKTIHYTIRESVRRMNIPNAKSQPSEEPAQPDTQSGRNIPAGGTVKRPDLLAVRRSKQLRAEVARHSMDVDEKVNALLEETADFRTRSQTFTDLNSMANNDAEPCQSHTLQFDHNHRSEMTTEGAADDRSTAAAKLLESSSNPVNYSNQNIHKDSSGSPIWKRRNEGRLRSPVTDGARTIDRHIGGAKGCLSGGDRQTDRHRMLPGEHAKYGEYDDTDC